MCMVVSDSFYIFPVSIVHLFALVFASIIPYNKQLLDEAVHDIKNFSDRSRCYLPKRS